MWSMCLIGKRSGKPRADARLGIAAGELAALGEFLRQEAPRPPTALLLQHHSGSSNAAAADAPLLPFPAPPAGGCVLSAAAQSDPGDSGKHAMAAAQAPEGSSELESSPAAVPASLCVACEAGAEDTALVDTAQAVCIRDALGDLTFRISPSAFFQVLRPVCCIPCRASRLQLCWSPVVVSAATYIQYDSICGAWLDNLSDVPFFSVLCCLGEYGRGCSAICAGRRLGCPGRRRRPAGRLLRHRHHRPDAGAAGEAMRGRVCSATVTGFSTVQCITTASEHHGQLQSAMI